jgi:hypothetical protein
MFLTTADSSHPGLDDGLSLGVGSQGMRLRSGGAVAAGLGGSAAAAVLWAGVTGAAQAAPLVYWSNSGGTTIGFADVSTGGGATLAMPGATVKGPIGVAIDSAAGRIYWANYSVDKISYANLDGSGGADLNTAGATVSEPWGVAIDPAGGRLYWINDGANSVSFANLDGSGGGDLNIAGATPPLNGAGVALDLAHGRIYWAANANDKISFARLDGSGGDDLNITGTTLNAPDGVAIDPVAGKLYWADDQDNKISFANLDGSGGGDLNTTGATVHSPEGVAVDPLAGRIYWGNVLAPQGISFARLDGTGGGNLPINPGVLSAPNFPALLYAPVAAGAPVVTESAPGGPLSCSTGAWAPDLLGSFLFRAPRSFAYSWQLGGAEIAGAGTSALTPLRPGSYSCRVTASNSAGSGSQASAPLGVSTIAKVTRLSLTHSVFAPARQSTPLSGRTARRHPRGTTFSFTLDQPATMRVKIQRRSSGRRVHGVCKPRRRTGPRCTRYTTNATLTRSAHAGTNKLRFSGRIRNRTLRPGRYRAVFIATDAAGSSKPQTLRFRVVAR